MNNATGPQVIRVGPKDSESRNLRTEAGELLRRVREVHSKIMYLSNLISPVTQVPESISPDSNIKEESPRLPDALPSIREYVEWSDRILAEIISVVE